MNDTGNPANRLLSEILEPQYFTGRKGYSAFMRRNGEPSPADRAGLIAAEEKRLRRNRKRLENRLATE